MLSSTKQNIENYCNDLGSRILGLAEIFCDFLCKAAESGTTALNKPLSMHRYPSGSRLWPMYLGNALRLLTRGFQPNRNRNGCLHLQPIWQFLVCETLVKQLCIYVLNSNNRDIKEKIVVHPHCKVRKSLKARFSEDGSRESPEGTRPHQQITFLEANYA